MKKKLCKSMGNHKITVEAYITCLCSCPSPDCNPCSNYPSDAYISQRDNRHYSAVMSPLSSLSIK